MYPKIYALHRHLQLGLFSSVSFVVFFIVFCSNAFSAQVTLAWDPNSEQDLAGYKLYYGTSSGVYSFIIDVGNSTSLTVSDLAEGQTYYFAVTAYNTSGVESAFSNELNTYFPTMGLLFNPVPFCRIVDTRISHGGLGPISGGTQRDFSITGLCDVPFGSAKAVMMNIAATNCAGMGNLRAFAYPKPVPSASVLNYGTVSELKAVDNAVIVPICETEEGSCTYDLSIWVSTTTDVTVDITGYFASP